MNNFDRFAWVAFYFLIFAFVFAVGVLLYMIGTMVRNGWRLLFGARVRQRAPVDEGAWPPAPRLPEYVYCWDKQYERIRFGAEDGVRGPKNMRCPSCDAPTGKYHLARCVVEQCPVCGETMSTCGCEISASPHAPPQKVNENNPRLQVLEDIEARSRAMNPKPDERDHLREGREGAMFGE